MKRTILVLMAATLSGCIGTIPINPASMTPEQLKAMAADKNMIVQCAELIAPGGFRGHSIYIQIDKNTMPSGGVSVGADCTVLLQVDEVKK